ncbi:KinB-signaling pathway activation protein [Hydrogenibacillus schlegelii]|nr:KinB-signaling pathway activation protein [Hydrogenibacillus schlegelii]
MDSRTFFRLLASTLAVGALGGAVAGFAVSFPAGRAGGWTPADWLMGFVGWLGGGAIFGALGLLGYVAFSFFDRLGRELFSPPYRALWDTLLWMATALLALEAVVFASGWERLGLPLPPPAAALALLTWSVFIAWLRLGAGGLRRAAPVVFFLFAGTILELVPALRLGNPLAFWDMAVPLTLVNGYLVLVAGRVRAARSAGHRAGADGPPGSGRGRPVSRPVSPERGRRG